MSKEIQALAPSGSTVYAQIVRAADGMFWNPAGAFEAYASANIADYALPMVEEGAASGFYTADFPAAIVAGKYNVVARMQAGGGPAESDAVIGTGDLFWSGLGAKDMIEGVWRWFYKKSVYDANLETLKTFADDGSTPNSSAAATVVAGVETKEAAV